MMIQTDRTDPNTSSENPLLRALATGSFREVFWPLLLGAAVLTLTLATMGNLGSSALLVGPVLALGLVTARVIVLLANAAASVLHLNFSDPHHFDDLRHFEISGRH